MLYSFYLILSKSVGAPTKVKLNMPQLTLAKLHPAGTSKDSDKCDLSKDSDIENSMVVNGKIYIFNHPAYVK